MTLGIVTVNGVKESAEKLSNFMEIPYKIIEKGDICNDYVKIINFGVSRFKTKSEIIMNKPRAIRRSLNKLRTFELLKGYTPIPTHSTNKEDAINWLMQGRKVVCREFLKGTRSKGLVITKDIEVLDATPAKFYTRFIAHIRELRVNCYRGEVLSVYNKVPSGDSFLFKIQIGYVPNDVLTNMAQQVYEKLELDFYGLDVLQTKKGNLFLLEVNSAPVLFPITMKRLIKRLKEVI